MLIGKESTNQIYVYTSLEMIGKTDEPQYCSKDVVTPGVTNFTLST